MRMGLRFVVVEAHYYFSLFVFWVKMAAPVELKYEKPLVKAKRDRSSLSLSFERKHEKDPPAVSRDADSVANGPTLAKALGLFFF